MKQRCRWVAAAAVAVLVGVTLLATNAARAEEPAPAAQPAGDPAASAEPAVEPAAATEPVAEPEPSPFTMNLTYYLFSDYVFRGLNCSEYRGEGREKPNHQLTTSFGLDLAQVVGEPRGTWGTLGFGTFFEWYAAQQILNPEHGAENVQEIDYILTWSYEVKPAATTVTLGYVFYDFPNQKRMDTSEWMIKLAHNDAWMWKWLLPDNEAGVLNPSVLFAQDVEWVGGCWAEFGVNHPFTVAEGLTVTPSALLAVDHRYLGPLTGRSEHGATQLAYAQYGITAAYDLSGLGRIPMDPGTWTLTGYLYWNDALGNPEDTGTIGNEFYGGVSLGWTF